MAIKTYYLLKRYIDTSERNLPFYVENLTSTAATLTVNTNIGDATNVEYSTDNSTWSSTKPSVPANGRVYIRANATYWGNTIYNIINCNQQFNIGGNIMSLLYGSSFTGTETSFPDQTKTHIFAGLFRGTFGSNYLVSAEKLALPATTMTNDCYSSMFNGCTALTTAPTLPATTLANQCYYGMFGSCTSLTTAPALPATTLADNCYSNMFSDCTSLTAAPTLPATTLAQGCYYGMFQRCTNLNSITVGATSWITTYTTDWLLNVSATGTFTKPSGTTIPEGTYGIPSGWTVVNV